CDAKGNVVDDFPINPNGSMLNIESITNQRGNLKLGMGHDERKLNALQQHPMNFVFISLREYIEEGCPDLSDHSEPQNIPLQWKSFPQLRKSLDPSRTIDISIRMLTDDNERTTAQLFLGEEVHLDRRRLLRIELAPETYNRETVERVVQELATMDFLDGIMLKKDLPTITGPGLPILTYQVIGKRDGRLLREFVPQQTVVADFPITHTEVPLPNIGGHLVLEKIRKHPWLSQVVTNVHAGRTWFFQDEEGKEQTLEKLLS
ncbi:MAG TPA: phosphoribosylformylglycinamidine synthase subunit PurQ, partial [Candidatus Nanoarchaeia archaeon]|nr:phosphoribosylformylglycinamidine synthase subunit PurQ [Candidatus Nanoarchaeia archaeon]